MTSTQSSTTSTAEPYIVPTCHQQVEILFQDSHLLLVNKPSGLLSVPGKHPKNRDCLITRLQQTFLEARIVHRLDLDTSGIMVVALSADCHRAMNQLFAERKVEKQYQAIVFGHLADDRGQIELPLICDWPNRPRQKVDHEHGKHALTYYEVSDQQYNQTLAAQHQQQTSRIILTPVTGRSHQLRVHMAAIDHPILGCDFYAHEQALAMSPRLLLHATTLSFIHPMTGKQLSGHCPCPF